MNIKSNDMSMSKTYAVLYDSSDHYAVLTQMFGSLWPRVLPWCIINGGIMILLQYLHHVHKITFEISGQGHSYISVVVAFLLVSRVNMSLARFNESRGYLGIMYRETRELINNLAIFSTGSTETSNTDTQSREWRNEVAYRTLLLLRTAMAVIDYPTDKIPAWDVPELSGKELEDIKRNTYLNTDVRKLMHAERSEYEESMRVPIRMSYMLKKSIHSQSKTDTKTLKEPMTPVQEMKLITSVDTFMQGYYGMRKFLTTPVPFPLIQMARTFLFLYVFTIPFALLSDKSLAFAHLIQVFILTYGFAGLELVAIELDNPFGDDENDFDNLALAFACMEDSYLTLLDVDGVEWTTNLRKKMGDTTLDNSSDNNNAAGETTNLI